MKYVNPNKEPVRLASTSGHIFFIDNEPVDVPAHMEAEARAQGCLSKKMFDQIQASGADTPQAMTSEEKRAKMKDVMKEMLDASDDQDYFTARDTPKVSVLEEKCGFDTDKEMRDSVWEEVMSESD